MSLSSTALVPTEQGSRYLQQLCKHWAHNLEVEFTPEHGKVVFPANARGADHPGDGVVTFAARDEGLVIDIDATSPEQLTGLQGAISRHLDRFAFRGGPLSYNWRDREPKER